MVTIAFYKGVRKGPAGWFNRVTRWWLGGQYSHCEVVFSDGICASSSFQDGGVRFKYIDFKPSNWDMVVIDADERAVRAWFIDHEDDGYDLLGLFGFVLRPFSGEKRRWVCSEALMEALGYSEAWRFDPCLAYSVLKARATT